MTRIIELRELYLLSNTLAGVRYFEEHGRVVEAWLALDGRILRQGEFHDFPVPDSSDVYKYEIVMTEPVLQGCIRPSVTRIYVIDGSGIPDSNSELPSSEATLLGNEGTSFSAAEEDDDDFEIDETFLANASSHSATIVASETNDYPLNGGHEDASSLGPTASTSKLVTPFHSFHSQSLPHVSRAQYDEASTVFIRTMDLSKLGIFSGDWVIHSTKLTDDCEIDGLYP